MPDFVKLNLFFLLWTLCQSPQVTLATINSVAVCEDIEGADANQNDTRSTNQTTQSGASGQRSCSERIENCCKCNVYNATFICLKCSHDSEPNENGERCTRTPINIFPLWVQIMAIATGVSIVIVVMTVIVGCICRRRGRCYFDCCCSRDTFEPPKLPPTSELQSGIPLADVVKSVDDNTSQSETKSKSKLLYRLQKNGPESDGRYTSEPRSVRRVQKDGGIQGRDHVESVNYGEINEAQVHARKNVDHKQSSAVVNETGNINPTAQAKTGRLVKKAPKAVVNLTNSPAITAADTSADEGAIYENMSRAASVNLDDADEPASKSSKVNKSPSSASANAEKQQVSTAKRRPETAAKPKQNPSCNAKSPQSLSSPNAVATADDDHREIYLNAPSLVKEQRQKEQEQLKQHSTVKTSQLVKKAESERHRPVKLPNTIVGGAAIVDDDDIYANNETAQKRAEQQRPRQVELFGADEQEIYANAAMFCGAKEANAGRVVADNANDIEDDCIYANQ